MTKKYIKTLSVNFVPVTQRGGLKRKVLPVCGIFQGMNSGMNKNYREVNKQGD
jgi:hypothetical protein